MRFFQKFHQNFLLTFRYSLQIPKNILKIFFKWQNTGSLYHYFHHRLLIHISLSVTRVCILCSLLSIQLSDWKYRYWNISKGNITVLSYVNTIWNLVLSTLSPSCVASTLRHQNRTLCSNLQITKKKNQKLSPGKVLENQFSKLNSKRPYFWQRSCTVVLKSGIFWVRPNIGPYDHTAYQKAVCLRAKPYIWQHCGKGRFGKRCSNSPKISE